MLEVFRIEKKEELEQISPFFITHKLWGTKELPKTYGFLAFIEDDGFYIKIVCEEENPLCRYKKNNDPVYLDSAVEAFICFSSPGEPYLNFEMNANGALRCRFGDLIPEGEWGELHCEAKKESKRWSVFLQIPLSFLEKRYKGLRFKNGSRIYCNFYKVCQGIKPEQYGAYAYIERENPCLHAPEFFAEARIL